MKSNVSRSQLHSAVISLQNVSKQIQGVEHYLTNNQKANFAAFIEMITNEIDEALNAATIKKSQNGNAKTQS